MPYSRNLAAYEDVKAVLDAALRDGLPVKYTLPSPSAAIRWRSRAYTFRRQTTISDYHSIIFRIEAQTPKTVLIDHEVEGVLERPSGETIPLSASPEEAEAERLRKEFGIE